MEIQIVNRLFLIIASYVSTVQSRFSDNFGLWKNLKSLNRDCTVLNIGQRFLHVHMKVAFSN